MDKVAALLEAALTLERACLGHAIVDETGQSAGILCATLRDADFVGSLNRATFGVLRRLLGRGVNVLDYSMIISEFQASGIFSEYTNCLMYVVELGENIKLRPDALMQKITELRRLRRKRNRLRLFEKELDGR